MSVQEDCTVAMPTLNALTLGEATGVSARQAIPEMDSSVEVCENTEWDWNKHSISLHFSILVCLLKFTSTDIDECALGLDRCHEHAVCTNTMGGYTCECRTGFTGDGFNCQGM